MTRQAASYNGKEIWLGLMIIWVIIVLCLILWQGRTGRQFAPVQAAGATVPEAAYACWESQGVHGRILLLFDDYPHMRGLAFYDGPPQLTNANFIEYAIFKNILRRIYLIVADDQWQAFIARRDIGVFRAFENGQEGVYLFTMSGVPLIAVSESGLPKIDETVLVYVNNELFPTDKVRAILKNKKIQSDIFQTYGGSSQ